ncbi:aminoacetone oxidase family FAD-binding enzyme [Nitratifractor sp.]|uniref:NAD(P)/FAD-dependent oxidoreductase n=1 Tax=Nitratifractor sp. TaxID=2268144 RepID=UPI0025F07424|nr:aminoacetone oxidase family FAD-binding enzyme [Nitratifractor sp.]
MREDYDLAILGGGAAGLMLAARLDPSISAVLIEGNREPGAKIAVSGGGRCNLTNTEIRPERYRGDASFIRPVLKRYDRRWLLEWFRQRGVKTRLEKGAQYFCVDRSPAVIRALKEAASSIDSFYGTRITKVEKTSEGFRLISEGGKSLQARRLAVATGGLSFPKLGASAVGLETAESFGHRIIRPAPALVGLTLQPAQSFFKSLSGVATEVEIRVGDRRWRDRLLFAHRGISGPAVLNASLWWERGEISVDFLPGVDLGLFRNEKKHLSSLLPLPRRAAKAFLEHLEIADGPCHRLNVSQWKRLEGLHDYRFAPAGTFGYSKAEVTRGGVSTEEVDPQTMESRRVPGLYFVGEVLDVTGELGGYNFQWAFSSAAVCADAINASVVG